MKPRNINNSLPLQPLVPDQENEIRKMKRNPLIQLKSQWGLV